MVTEEAAVAVVEAAGRIRAEASDAAGTVSVPSVGRGNLTNGV